MLYYFSYLVYKETTPNFVNVCVILLYIIKQKCKHDEQWFFFCMLTIYLIFSSVYICILPAHILYVGFRTVGMKLLHLVYLYRMLNFVFSFLG